MLCPEGFVTRHWICTHVSFYTIGERRLTLSGGDEVLDARRAFTHAWSVRRGKDEAPKSAWGALAQIREYSSSSSRTGGRMLCLESRLGLRVRSSSSFTGDTENLDGQ